MVLFVICQPCSCGEHRSCRIRGEHRSVWWMRRLTEYASTAGSCARPVTGREARGNAFRMLVAGAAAAHDQLCWRPVVQRRSPSVMEISPVEKTDVILPLVDPREVAARVTASDDCHAYGVPVSHQQLVQAGRGQPLFAARPSPRDSPLHAERLRSWLRHTLKPKVRPLPALRWAGAAACRHYAATREVAAYTPGEHRRSRALSRSDTQLPAPRCFGQEGHDTN